MVQVLSKLIVFGDPEVQALLASAGDEPAAHPQEMLRLCTPLSNKSKIPKYLQGIKTSGLIFFYLPPTSQMLGGMERNSSLFLPFPSFMLCKGSGGSLHKVSGVIMKLWGFRSTLDPSITQRPNATVQGLAHPRATQLEELFKPKMLPSVEAFGRALLPSQSQENLWEPGKQPILSIKSLSWLFRPQAVTTCICLLQTSLESSSIKAKPVHSLEEPPALCYFL